MLTTYNTPNHPVHQLPVISIQLTYTTRKYIYYTHKYAHNAHTNFNLCMCCIVDGNMGIVSARVTSGRDT
jgi:hypothetical protein